MINYLKADDPPIATLMPILASYFQKFDALGPQLAGEDEALKLVDELLKEGRTKVSQFCFGIISSGSSDFLVL